MRTNSQVAEPDKYLRVGAFAKKMDMAEKTARRWVSEGRVSHVRFGRSIRIPISEFDRLVVEGTRPARREMQ
jgi:excisionase family DNA binding protein